MIKTITAKATIGQSRILDLEALAVSKIVIFNSR